MIVTHYVRHAPESDQCREHTAREPFTNAHVYEATNTSPGPFVDKWPSAPAPIDRTLALELVNKWNRGAESYRYWIEA